MNRDALFCDGTQDYVSPAEPAVNEKVFLRFRTAHNDVEEVNLLTGKDSHAMWKVRAGDDFDFYAIEWLCLSVVSYHEHAISSGSDAKACAYIELEYREHHVFGVGIHSNVSIASIRGVLAAVNRALTLYGEG